MPISVIIVCNRDLAAAVCKTGLVDHCSDLLREPTATQPTVPHSLRCPLAPPPSPTRLSHYHHHLHVVCLSACKVYRTNTNRQTATMSNLNRCRPKSFIFHSIVLNVLRIPNGVHTPENFPKLSAESCCLKTYFLVYDIEKQLLKSFSKFRKVFESCKTFFESSSVFKLHETFEKLVKPVLSLH